MNQNLVRHYLKLSIRPRQAWFLCLQSIRHGQRIKDNTYYSWMQGDPGQPQGDQVGPSEMRTLEVLAWGKAYVGGLDGYWYCNDHAPYRRIELTNGEVEPTYEELGLVEDANIIDICWALGTDNIDLTIKLGRQPLGAPSSPVALRQQQLVVIPHGTSAIYIEYLHLCTKRV